jgi:hypothetical protein
MVPAQQLNCKDAPEAERFGGAHGDVWAETLLPMGERYSLHKSHLLRHSADCQHAALLTLSDS